MARLLQFLALALASLALMTRPALAQQILRDAETEAFMADMSAPLVKAAGMTPKNVQVLVINDPEINAFVAGGSPLLPTSARRRHFRQTKVYVWSDRSDILY